MAQNACPKCQLLVIRGSLPVSLSYMLMHIGPAIVHAVPHSSRFHLVKTLFALPLSQCNVLNISVPTLLLLHLPYQMLTFDVPRHALLSKPWIPFSDIPSFPPKINYRSTHKSFRLFSSMVQNQELEWIRAFRFIPCSFGLYSFIPSNLRFQAEIFRTHSQTSFIPWICHYAQSIILTSHYLIPLSSGSATCALARTIPCRSISSFYHSLHIRPTSRAIQSWVLPFLQGCRTHKLLSC